MASEHELHEEMLSLYRRTGEATGDYWPARFLQDVRRQGGLAVAKKLLSPGNASSGFDRLVIARRADLSVEAIALSERFSYMFSAEELNEARRRLAELPPDAFPRASSGDDLPEEVPLEDNYVEGAVQRVLVNRYERDPAARSACVQHHGFRCMVCGFDFEERYGGIGNGFIHVHHKRPLGSLRESYRVDPKKDLVPVCPNCHAMLHRRDPPFDIEQLRAQLREP